MIAAKSYEVTPPLASAGSVDSNGMTAGGDPIRMVGLNKSPNEMLVCYLMWTYLPSVAILVPILI